MIIKDTLQLLMEYEYCTDCNSEAFINNGVELKNNQIVIPKPNWLK